MGGPALVVKTTRIFNCTYPLDISKKKYIFTDIKMGPKEAKEELT